ncbi:MAG: iron-sulfur cluster assembly accessory protein [Cyclobacteriaceae bacterium]|nr:iron-sulfur cluster assembly accessory protein [Cyclobacteriaceae bacterium]
MSLEPVSLSKLAAEEIKIIMQSDEIPNDHRLRIGVKEGGCGTGGFTIGFDTKKENDLEYVNHGVQIYVDKKHVMYLMGMEVNYREEGDDKWGFVFENPDEK